MFADYPKRISLTQNKDNMTLKRLGSSRVVNRIESSLRSRDDENIFCAQ